MKFFLILCAIYLVIDNVNSFEGRIIGGIDSGSDDNFVVRIESTNSAIDGPFYVSTGVVVSQSRILTVAQAVDGYTFVRVHSFFGTYVPIQINQVVVHPDYNPDTLSNNVAVLLGLFTNTDRFSFLTVQPDIADAPGPSSIYYIFGVGLTETDGTDISDGIKFLAQSAITNAECTLIYNRLVVIESNFCGVTADGVSKAWHGDQGGPVTNLRKELMGLISAFGNDLSLPTIYVNIYEPSVHAFIIANLQ